MQTLPMIPVLLSASAALCLLGPVLQADTLLVDPSSPGAFDTVQAAIDAALPGDVVQVAPGTYVENIDYLGKAITVISLSGPEVTTIECSPPGSVVTFDDAEGPDSVLDGFTIRGGTGTFHPVVMHAVDHVGGGIYCRGSSPTITGNVFVEHCGFDGLGGGIFCEDGSPLVSGNIFQNHSAEGGGGMYVRGSSAPTIEGNDFLANQTVGAGGALLVEAGAAPLVLGNTFEGNGAVEGGAIYCKDSAPILRGNDFRDNSTNSDEGGGGAVSVSACDVLVEDNVFIDNRANEGGGGVICYGGTATIVGNDFEGNTPGPWGKGAAIELLTNATTVSHNTLVANGNSNSHAAIAGHGEITHNEIRGNLCIGLFGASGLVSDNVIVGNTSAGIVCFAGPDTLILRNTIADNATEGLLVAFGSPSVESTILWGNGDEDADQIHLAGGSVTVAWSDVQGGWPGTGNFDADPLFVDSLAEDYRLDLASPCLDAGNPTDPVCGVDVAGMPRKLDGRLVGYSVLDVGAHECGHVRLDAVLEPGQLRLDTSGTTGMRLVMFLAEQPGQTCLLKYGTLLFDVTQPWVLVPWGRIPISVSLAVPPSLAGIALVFQNVAFAPGNAAANTSNAQVVVLP